MDSTDINTEKFRRVDLSRRFDRLEAKLPPIPARAIGLTRATARRADDWTRAELYERARGLDIDGRSSMSKRELVWALRSA